MSNKSEQFKFKLEKKYWDLETCRKSWKIFFSSIFNICFIFSWLFSATNGLKSTNEKVKGLDSNNVTLLQMVVCFIFSFNYLNEIPKILKTS